MLVRFYVAPQQGDGSHGNPFRSILNDLINISQGDYFQEIDNPARRISICCVHASQATHDAIVADGRALEVGNLIEDTQLKNHLDSPINTIPNIAALKTALETKGISSCADLLVMACHRSRNREVPVRTDQLS